MLLVLTLAEGHAAQPTRPIALHPDNGHYFLFRERPTVLITSGEHYGAVLNLDFDYVRYLDELHASGLNLTRTFSGVYHEIPGSFRIQENTLAPAADRFVSPWPRIGPPGALDGGAKFDLSRWNEDYFARLKDFITQAGRREIVVELVLWCTVYDEALWNVNPMNPENNVNGIGAVDRKTIYTLDNGGLLGFQEEQVRKTARELRDFDNVYYEVCNEPYFGGVSSEWNDHIVRTLVEAEAGFPARHLIAQNIANGSQLIQQPNPAVSIFNFHYAFPPDTVRENYDLGKVIAFDETGFRGQEDRVYRTEAWEFIIAGGAVYSNLDYSFTPGAPAGTAKVLPPTPGGGGASLRRQLRLLKEWIYRFDFLGMKPLPSAILESHEGVTARLLAEPGRQYALYLRRTVEKDPPERAAPVSLDLPAGKYRTEWLDPQTGAAREERLDHPGGRCALTSPAFREDAALRLVRAD